MAEDTEGQDTGAEAIAGGVDPAAVALALVGAGRETADAFLKNRNSLIDLQKHHLQRQFTALDLGIWEKRQGVLLRIATAFTDLASGGTAPDADSVERVNRLAVVLRNADVCE